MTSDLVKRLDGWADTLANEEAALAREARDRIEALEREVALLYDDKAHDADAIKAGRELVQALERERQWRPIEDAPRDGTTVLLWVPDATPSVSVGYFVYNLWFTDGGLPTSPTHWLPLPQPPALEGE